MQSEPHDAREAVAREEAWTWPSTVAYEKQEEPRVWVPVLPHVTEQPDGPEDSHRYVVLITAQEAAPEAAVHCCC